MFARRLTNDLVVRRAGALDDRESRNDFKNFYREVHPNLQAFSYSHLVLPKPVTSLAET